MFNGFGIARGTAIATLCLGACALAPDSPPGQPDDATGEGSEGAPPRITVMTWNVYYGGGGAGGVPDLGEMFESALATDFGARAGRIARAIETTNPHVVCLQEVARWHIDEILGDGEETIDFFDFLLDRLHARGLDYDLVGSLETIDFEAPSIIDGDLFDVKWEERLVMLVRRSSQLQVSNVRLRRYNETYTISIPANEDLEFRRGWIAADITFKGKKARYVCTHLESLSSSVREAQASQLIDWLSGTNLRLVVMGDTNSQPGTSAHHQFIGAGYVDAWTAIHGPSGGPTCCQSGDLQNNSSELNRRIDQVFLRGATTPVSSARVGHRQADRTPSGLWPSDHAGVVAKVRLD